MRTIIAALAFFPLLLSAQGIRFDTNSSWDQIIEKAKKENKYILIDCFATWCGPCKEMDKNIYSKDSVGQFFDQNFISVKVQFDTTKNDNEQVKAWYADAHRMSSQYKITAYPTFLFLSPNGELVHKGIGYKTQTAFIDLGKEAIDPGKQFYTLLKNYRQSVKDYSTVLCLITAAQKVQERGLSDSMATDYIDNYLHKLPDSSFLTKENITFIALYPKNLHSRERLFEWSFNHPATIDTLLHDKGFSSRVVNYVINQEELEPALLSGKRAGKTPNWEKLSRSIKHKFSSRYVQDNMLSAKVRWYREVKDWENYIIFMVQKVEKDSLDGNGPKGFWGFAGLNSNAWDIFQHSESKEQLEKAVSWSCYVNSAVPNYSSFIDTKANLLYKLGKKDEALALEAIASKLAPHDNDVQETYQKMQEGKPTW